MSESKVQDEDQEVKEKNRPQQEQHRVDRLSKIFVGGK